MLRKFINHICASIPLLIILCVLSGCACNEALISVHTDYLSHENLASYHVQTPDPRLNNPPIGQRLIINWSVPRNYLDYEDLHLEITMRFRNREELVENIDILKRRGTFVYPVLNEDYISTRGILTYKVDLVGSGSVLKEWRHQIWTEWIAIDHTENSSTTPSQEPLEPIYDENFE